MSQDLRNPAQSDMSCDDSSESEEDSVDPSVEGPTEFCTVCGITYENKEEGCEFCHSKLDEESIASSDEMEED